MRRVIGVILNPNAAGARSPGLGARLRALGSGCFLATRRFYHLCGELAHKKQQLARLGDEGGTAQLIESVRDEMRRLSPQAKA